MCKAKIDAGDSGHKMLEINKPLMYSIVTMMWEGINQRQFPRANYKCRISISGEESGGGIQGVTENIGAGGVCLVLGKRLELFESVSLELFLDKEVSPLVCQGSVVWVVKKHPAVETEPVTYDTGVEFHDVPDAVRAQMEKLVSEILDV